MTPVPGSFVPFAQSLGTCTAPSCDEPPRVVDPAVPNEAFPTLGGVAGGFEVYISEGYAYIDMVVAEDGDHNESSARWSTSWSGTCSSCHSAVPARAQRAVQFQKSPPRSGVGGSLISCFLGCFLSATQA